MQQGLCARRFGRLSLQALSTKLLNAFPANRDIITCLLLTFSGVIIWYSLPFFLTSLQLNEVSAAPGGLPYRWFLKSFIVTAFVLLALAGVSRLTRVWVALFGQR